MDHNKTFVFEVVLLGDTGSGKRDLLCGTGNPIKCSACYFYTEKTFLVDWKLVTLNIWTRSGTEADWESVLALQNGLCRSASGAIIVFNITKRDTFKNIHRWYSLLDRTGVPTMMFGNRCDLTGHREVTTDEGKKLASELGIIFMEANVDLPVHVEKAFTVLARDMIIQKQSKREFSLYKNYERMMMSFVRDWSRTMEEAFKVESTLKDILRYGVEENYHIRVMVVGNENVGKSTLVRRLLKKHVHMRKYNSTNGIDVHIHSSDVDIETGTWDINNMHETGFPLIAQFRRLIGGKARNESISGKPTTGQPNRDFHFRAAKILQNPEILQQAASAKMKQNEESVFGTLGSIQRIRLVTDDDSLETYQGRCSLDYKRMTPVHQSVDQTDLSDIREEITKAKALNCEQEKPTARVDFYDFAGQIIFHASHPTFLSARAIYILTFDVSRILNKTVNIEETYKTKCPLHCQSTATHTDIESILFWLNIVYMFAESKHDIQPHVILVGTHLDKLPKQNRDEICNRCFREIRCTLADSPLTDILSTKEFLVDNTKPSNPGYAQIQAEIFRLAQLQPYWGEQTPSKWLPLDREIQCKKESGVKVLSVRQIKELNNMLEITMSDDRELQMFLQNLHNTGEILFFNESILRDYIVLDPVWLIDALKAIITADQFAIRSPKYAGKWKSFCETGIIKHSIILAIFKENVEDPALLENHTLVIRLMEKFMFIASPINTTEDSEETGGATAKEDSEETNCENIEYIVPSMVNVKTDSKLITSVEGLSTTVALCMVAKNSFLPPTVFHKLLAVCISEWQIVEKNGKKQIFRGVCRFNLDNMKNYKLTVFAVGYAIHARIISYVDELGPLSDVCKPVLEFLVHSLRKVLRSMGFSDEFRTCVQCPKFSPIDNGGYLDIDLMDKQTFVTCDDCETSHVMQTVDLLGSWTDIQSDLSHDAEGYIVDESSPLQDTTNDNISGQVENLLEQAGSEKCLADSPITQEHLNHARVCNALVTVCADGLRDILSSQIPPGYPDVHQLLLARKPALTTMKQFRQEQLNVLFPDPHGRYTATVDQFDITLLYALIRNVSAVPAPVTGWGKPPIENPRDTSLGANVERIRICRNNVSGHSMDGRLEDQAFEDHWKCICLIMGDIENILGEKGYKDALEKRKDQVLSPKEATTLKTMFKQLQAEVKTVTEKMRTLQTLVENNA